MRGIKMATPTEDPFIARQRISAQHRIVAVGSRDSAAWSGDYVVCSCSGYNKIIDLIPDDSQRIRAEEYAEHVLASPGAIADLVTLRGKVGRVEALCDLEESDDALARSEVDGMQILSTWQIRKALAEPTE